MMSTVYLSLGSNIGDRMQYLKNAIKQLSAQLSEVKASSVYQTKPWGKTGQPNFLNMCLMAQTNALPQDLLKKIKLIEKHLGRSSSEKWGPREIDIDILFYDDLIIKEDGLAIPHPEIAARAFVLVPLAELNPDLLHPIKNQPIAELLKNLETTGIEKYAA